jgi:hypothetical protein
VAARVRIDAGEPIGERVHGLLASLDGGHLILHVRLPDWSTPGVVRHARRYRSLPRGTVGS